MTRARPQGRVLPPALAAGFAGILNLIVAMAGAAPAGAETGDGLPDSRSVTYDQILADPDNIELSYLYAISQIRKSDLLGASATLDRLILLAPREPNIRALRAIVLYRLDNLREAQKEFADLLTLELDPDLRRGIERYAAELERRDQHTRMTLLTSVGYQYDTNRSGAPNSGQVRTFLGTFDLTADGRKEDDHSLTGLVRFGIEHDLATQNRNTLFASASAYGADQFQLDDFDTIDLSAQAGGRFEFGAIFLTPVITYDHLFLGGDSYIDSVGASIRADLRVNDPVNLWLRGDMNWIDYHNTTLYPAGELQSGGDVGITVGADFYIGTDHRLTVSATHHGFNSDSDWESYVGERLNINHTWLIGGGAFLMTDLFGEYDNYDMADPITGETGRDDWIYRARMTLGVPVQTLLGAEEWPTALDGLTVSVYGEYYRADSNITNYEYDNARGGLTISKRWEF
ncbi:tetratricopeptide repeat protein [Dongia sp.]|uniref:tetratricopeptide repeat protein n=1 Tax=Dongia sp. TaxID=1977262 RepID=UPI0035AEF24C